MEFTGDVIFLSKEEKVSKKGNTYLSILCMQGVETLNCLSEVDLNAEMGTPLNLRFSFDPRFKNLKIVGVDM